MVSRGESARKGKTTGASKKGSDAGEFDRAMTAFLKHLEMVIRARESGLLIKTGVNPFLKYLNKYSQVYQKTSVNDPLEHLEYFKPIARRYLKKISSGDDGWLIDNSIVIQYGAGTPAENRTREIKIMISGIYGMARTLRDKKEEELNGKPDEEWAKAHELNYPDILLLDLYRILVLAAPESDRDEIRSQVERLERDLGLSEGDSTQMESLGMGPLMGAIGQLAGKFGVKIPEGALPPDNEVGNIVERFISNEGVKSTFSRIVEDIKDCSTPEQLMTGLVKNLGDPSLTEAFTETAAETIRHASAAVKKSTEEPTGPTETDEGETDGDDYCTGEVCYVDE